MPEKPASYLGLTPSLWASWVPFGLNAQHPNNFGEVFRAAWENRGQAGYAWRILNQGCCDGCALGTTGLSDWTLKGPHLCNIRLRLLRMNTQPAFDPAVTAYSIPRTNARAARTGRGRGATGWPTPWASCSSAVWAISGAGGAIS